MGFFLHFAFLFKGTVRSNLDPFDDYTDAKLYECLERVGLYTERDETQVDGPLPSSTTSTSRSNNRRIASLTDVVTEGGGTLSVGQRQLLVIARALLHGSTIVIMDEATSSVDAETDAMITECLRREFASATVLTIAHR